MRYDEVPRLLTVITQVKVTNFMHDNAGNLTLENAVAARTTNTFDPENRLTKVESAGGVSTYTYQADGLRRSK